MPAFESFARVYPYYLSEYFHRRCRRLHFIGSSVVLATLLLALLIDKPHWLWLAPLAGYGFAWAGHVIYEKNRPATFKHPLYSLCGDRVLYVQNVGRRGLYTKQMPLDFHGITRLGFQRTFQLAM